MLQLIIRIGDQNFPLQLGFVAKDCEKFDKV